MSRALNTGLERRTFGRVATRRHGWIVVPGRPRIACLVSDLSVNGAQLELPEATWVPLWFTLVIDTANFSSHCEVRHQRESRIGVRFVAGPQQADRRGGLVSDDVASWRGVGATGSQVRDRLAWLTRRL